jgi:hypothetical protein
VHQAMAYHLVFAFESLAAFGARAACNWAVVWSTLAVHVLVGAGEHILADYHTYLEHCIERTSADIASGTFQLCNSGRRICTAQVS